MASRRQRHDPEGEQFIEREPVSRSQRKRDSTALQLQGEKLAFLSPARLAELPLPPDLAKALEEFRRLTSREARRRHLQYIGRVMREAAEEGSLLPVLDALDALERAEVRGKARQR